MAPDSSAGSTCLIFRGSRPVPAIAADDRGLAYGDGLFETMRAHEGDVPWWDRHWARLRHGAERLGIPLPAQDLVRRQSLRLLGGGSAVLRLQLTRGCGGRGYTPPLEAEPTWMLARHPLPASAPPGGLRLRWCETRLSEQPALAGLKHCNRLEQVLARAEWNAPGAADAEADEGLMCGSGGQVVCATSANLFILHGGEWATPPVDRCGVAGVVRGWLVEQFGVTERPLERAEVETAEAVVLTNAVRGILPVARLGGRRWPLHPCMLEWQRRLADAHPAFAMPAPEIP
jgi:4-amino-4-deoxychorismate lyase